MSQLKSCALVAAASALICGNATAQNDQWSGNSSRNINDPLNWSLGVPNNTKWMEFSPAWSTGLLEQRDDEEIGVALQRPDQHVAGAGGRDDLVDRIGEAHASRRLAMRAQDLRRGRRGELHVDR